ncbi:MAG: polysaccharide deacetylase family protein [Desulfuromonadales bacterium]|nr:polysaccharide deacetylase family protein [Desulfuromonadales bacterium]
MENRLKVYIGIDNPELRPEVGYLCRLLGSILQVEFLLKTPDQSMHSGFPTIFYGAKKNTEERAGAFVRIQPDDICWNFYLQKNAIRNEVITNLFARLQEPETWSYEKRAVEADLFFGIIFLITRYEEIFSEGHRDRHGRFPWANDSRQGLGITSPVINIWIRKLADLLAAVFNQKVEFRQNRPIAVISHDIDIPFYYKKFFNEASMKFKSILGRKNGYTPGRFGNAVRTCLGLCDDPYDTFSYFNHQESTRQIRSTYFLLMSRENRWGLDLSKYSKRLRMLRDEGHELALHPGYEGFNNALLTQVERDKVRDLTGVEPVGTRSHFLRFDFIGSYRIRQEAGFLYDSTLGYAEQEGFRCGVCTPFKPFDPVTRKEIDIWEIPMTLMDGTLADYQKLTPEQGENKIRRLIENVQSLNGVIVFNWHNSFFANGTGPWKQVYENSLDLLQASGFEFLTCNEVACRWSSQWE